ncbi:asparagine synthase (glutamine-hydrolyzing) [Sulfurovum sp. bin170]|uniref:asparagine synthase (glutamine-hydrolyzing) n=1 Tax=Sulfurovum sp. bin170 TaxID=2695268 RepID=UPI0013DFA015|nr:asparagine synthase (glutamine-hydrolyzing) [Sulfurovum sp. bin170]NEW59759.1 asparagine synthase (glutamine-hydrolyzing) [Sulfurovum sp. bin170]
MCSIMGYYNTKQSLEEIEQLNRTLSHRGVDNSQVKEYIFAGNRLSLGHNRLAIQDLDARANQPMESERFSIVFNGEIYNHMELREECNNSWLTHSDTETLLALFNRFGIEQTISKLIGMFAIALFDKFEQRLYLIRDRVGIKPLYWTYQNGEFAFASELKGFAPHLKTKESNKALIQFMSFGYAPSHNSYYEDIYKLEAGHLLIFDGETIKKKRYWSLPNSKIDIGYEEALEETERLIRSSIKYRLLSDVEVGSFLSGGIDSSLVSSIMQQSTNQQIKTFTIGFEDKNYNEAGFAKEVAEHIGSDHYEYIFGVDDVIALMADMDRYYDEPFGDASALPTMLLSKFTKEKVTVALSGDGGDELFLGYDRYFFTDKYYKIFNKMPQFSRNILSSLARLSKQDRLEKIAYPLKYPTKENLYSVIASYLKPWQMESMFDREFLYQNFDRLDYLSVQEIKSLNQEDSFDNFSKIDFYRYLPDDILTKVDRASMKYSLEARVPLLDHRIVEFAYSLPTEIKLKHGAKSILKDILYKQVPKRLIDRPKMGFRVPLQEWFRGEMRDMLQDKIESLDERFNKPYLRKLFNEHQKGKNYENIFWNIMRLP